ncbi:inovirus Gp2 family protein [Serratia fonticola]|uniref:inovirus Gp2 family protein n=1 Tax=Serratia fonticola TaxID=47917 RepID=UPI000466682D|nr:inovirus Gp2 family protein [Serratia fonticola]
MSINTPGYYILNQYHNARIKTAVAKALHEHPRTLMIRVDLYLPDKSFNADSAQMTRFIASLKAQVNADIQRRINTGVRVHPCNLRYVWTREFCQSEIKHYHVALLFNKDTYAYPGTYRPGENGEYMYNLSLMIMEAWVRALSLDKDEGYKKHYSLVHFTHHNYRHLNVSSPSFSVDYDEVLTWLSYFAKEYSKNHSDGQRNFGSSQS